MAPKKRKVKMRANTEHDKSFRYQGEEVVA
jgi:hypothetical protein